VAGGFLVDVAWLDGVANNLAGCADRAMSALNALEETGPQRTGHDDLDKACDQFHDKWDDEVNDFRKGIESLRGVIEVAKGNYGNAEESAAQRVGAVRTSRIAAL
jgi:hypothetical protein